MLLHNSIVVELRRQNNRSIEVHSRCNIEYNGRIVALYILNKKL